MSDEFYSNFQYVKCIKRATYFNVTHYVGDVVALTQANAVAMCKKEDCYVGHVPVPKQVDVFVKRLCFDGELLPILKELTVLLVDYPSAFIDGEVEIDDGGSQQHVHNLYYKRLESLEEAGKREEYETQTKHINNAKEFALYKELQAKYGEQ